MSDHLTCSSSLFLRPLLSIGADGNDLVIESEEERFRFSNVSLEAAARLLNRIDGSRSPSEILHRHTTHDAAFLQCIFETGLAIERPTDSILPGNEIATQLEAAFEVWNRRLFSHRLWQQLAGGTASYELVLGWLVETYHFIRGANARLPYAVAQCLPGRQRNILVEHFAEEYDHDKLFVQSLACFGINEPDVRSMRPLPGTQAVIDWMRAAARLDVLAYAACSGLLESTGSDAVAAQRFYDALEAHYSFAPGFIAPMRRHIELDKGFGHGHVMRDLFETEGEIELKRADLVAQTAHGFVETLEEWFFDILSHYSTPCVIRARAARRYRPVDPGIGNQTVGHRNSDTTISGPLIGAAVQCEDDGKAVRIEDQQEALTFRGPSADILRQLVPLLDGSNSVPEIACEIATSTAVVENHLAPLIEAELVLDTASFLRVSDSGDLCEALSREANFWNRSLFNHGFLRRLYTGEASQSEVIGWGVEFYHFVRGANQYMAAGVAHCSPTAPWLDELARHYAEECDHAKIFSDGLAACGLDISTLESAPPLPTTSALLNRFTEIAQRSTLGYAALFAFMRPIQADKPLQEDYTVYSQLARHYPYATGLFEAFSKHGEIDSELGHGEAAIYRIVREPNGLDARQREQVISALRMAAESFVLFIEGIQNSYKNSTVFCIRRPAIIHALPKTDAAEA